MKAKVFSPLFCVVLLLLNIFSFCLMDANAIFFLFAFVCHYFKCNMAIRLTGNIFIYSDLRCFGDPFVLHSTLLFQRCLKSSTEHCMDDYDCNNSNNHSLSIDMQLCK